MGQSKVSEGLVERVKQVMEVFITPEVLRCELTARDVR